MGIQPLQFFRLLADKKVDFFTGVPDSLLKQLCLCIDANVSSDKHIIAANEGNAIALATGYHLGTGKMALVYMQNSGIGNAINPLLSLADPEVYSIPMLILIGWRGEPGVKDEPQHIKQGKVQLDLLDSINLQHDIISAEDTEWNQKITKGIDVAISENRPYAIVVKKGTFEKYSVIEAEVQSELMAREEALEILLKHIPNDAVIVATTGKTSREIFEIREKNKEPHFKDFLTVGSMGHCSSIALGIALAQPERKVICIDGDGAFLMHMGSLAAIGKSQPKNLYHILMNNYVHESVGGQKTAIDSIDVQGIVKSANYKNIIGIDTLENLSRNISGFLENDGPSFLEIKLKPGSRTELGRPTIKPIDNKRNLIEFLKK
ncbi:MAG: phosphonopyruvate decarboxylase [Candidatus Marinimicrobia bacterium]|nr:phosphonopyruvate decarboxylase [Candidatus Neomarinimicrobiota bacterium]